MKILFVCTGNTCRSAMAEYIMRKNAEEKGIKDIEVQSCGIQTLPTFRVPPIVLSIMQQEGMDLSQHTARQITKELVDDAHSILVMDTYHKEYIRTRFPYVRDKTFLLKEYVGEEKDLVIPDPMGQSDDVYLRTREELKKNIQKLTIMMEEKK